MTCFPISSRAVCFDPLLWRFGLWVRRSRRTLSFARGWALSMHAVTFRRWIANRLTDESTGLDVAIRRHVQADAPLLAICGGPQMHCDTLHDPHGVEGSGAGQDPCGPCARGATALPRRCRPPVLGQVDLAPGDHSSRAVGADLDAPASFRWARSARDWTGKGPS